MCASCGCSVGHPCTLAGRKVQRFARTYFWEEESFLPIRFFPFLITLLTLCPHTALCCALHTSNSDTPATGKFVIGEFGCAPALGVQVFASPPFPHTQRGHLCCTCNCGRHFVWECCTIASSVHRSQLQFCLELVLHSAFIVSSRRQTCFKNAFLRVVRAIKSAI